MGSEHLQTTLRDLESELASLDAVSAETREALEATVRGIEAVLLRSAPAAERESVRSGLKAAIERFETSHPTLTGILSRLVDALAQMGI